MLQLLIWVAGFVVLYVSFHLVHGRYVTSVIKKLAPLYLSYDSSYHQWQKNRNNGLAILTHIETGASSPDSLKVIEKYRSDVFNSYKNCTDSQILAHYSKKMFSGEQGDLREIFRYFSKMHEIVDKSPFFDITNFWNLIELSDEISAGAHYEFTIHDYSEWGAHEKPDFGRSLRWELEMLFVNGYIPREKNYGEWIS